MLNKISSQDMKDLLNAFIDTHINNMVIMIMILKM